MAFPGHVPKALFAAAEAEHAQSTTAALELQQDVGQLKSHLEVYVVICVKRFFAVNVCSKKIV